MRCAILTVSTSAAAGSSADVSGPELVRLAREGGADVASAAVLPDDAGVIEAWLHARVADGYDLILTTGGTGLTPDDVTPEATRAVIERDAPGFAEAMRAESIRRGTAGMLSRGVSGIAGRTLIVNFPGSPGAVRELFPVIAPVLGHAVGMLRREPGQPRGH